MKFHSYAAMGAHKLEHDNFTTKVAALQKRLTDGSLVMSIEVIDFLRDGLCNHILGIDKKMGAFLNERGLR